MVLLYSGIIVLVVAGIILVGSILFYQRSLARFETITNVNREALQAIAAQIKLMGEVAHNLEEATAATGQTLIAVSGREEELKKAIRTVNEAQATLTAKIDNLTVSNEKVPQQVKQALDEGAKASQAANNVLIEGVKGQINGLSNGELAKKIDAMIEQQKTINAKVPKPDAQGAAAARARSKNREMDNAIRYP
jgi:mRNA-degrading endonuclease HigB of HigAB toxin-antitoxin module